mmetsp:Transcript_39502/g.75662  ORF Transcript_39502/g.75662 Transcript_39502/m.75662 type:complete len:263 (-) Transcript_39502:444-1232(-)
MCTSRASGNTSARPKWRGTLPRIASSTSSRICIGGSARGWFEVSTTRSHSSANAHPSFVRSPRRSSPSQPITTVSGKQWPSMERHSLTTRRARTTSSSEVVSCKTANARGSSVPAAVSNSSVPGGGVANCKASCRIFSVACDRGKPSRRNISRPMQAAARAAFAPEMPKMGKSTSTWPQLWVINANFILPTLEDRSTLPCMTPAGALKFCSASISDCSMQARMRWMSSGFFSPSIASRSNSPRNPRSSLMGIFFNRFLSLST